MTGTRFKPYPETKESGVEWLGQIPVHWDVKPLKRVTDCLDGQRVPVNSEERARMQGEFPYWGANGVLDHVDSWLFDEPLVLLGEDGAPFFERHKPVSFFVRGKIWVNNHAHVLRSRPGIAPQFLAYVLNTVDYRSFIGGTTRDKLTQEHMRAIPVQMPDPSEQQAIADFLDRETAKIDVLVEKKERLIELLQEKRTAMITHAVTTGLDPNVPTKDSGIEWLGQIPEHWDLRKMKHSGRLLGGGTPSKAKRVYWEGNIPWVSPKDMHTSQVFDTEDHITEQAVRESATEIVPPGSLLIVVRSGILRHTIPVAVNQCHVALNQDMKALVADEEDVVRYFMYLVAGKQQELLIEWRSEGATVESLRFEWVSGCVFPFPPQEERRAIVDFLDQETAKIDALIAKVGEAIERLKEYRTALISAAGTGKIDVRNLYHA